MIKLSKITRFRSFCKTLRCRQSSSVAGKPEELCSNSKSPENFEDLMNRRETEVRCSIIVKIDSLDLSSNVYHYCKQFGAIKNAIAYSMKDKQNFVLLEYENEKSVNEAYKYCGYPVNQTPWLNQYLNLRKSALIESNSKDAPILFSHIHEPQVVDILKNAKSVNDQALLLYQHTCINDLTSRITFIGTKQITRIINYFMPTTFPNAKVYPFGSTLSGFGKLSSDLDVALRYDNVKDIPDVASPLKFHNHAHQTDEEFRATNRRQVKCVAALIDQFLPRSNTVRYISATRVPLVSYYDMNVGCSVDLSINNLNGFSDTQLLYTLGALDSRVRPFIVLVRRWAKEFQIIRHGPGDRFTNLKISYIAMSFLQNLSEPVIPTYEDMVHMMNKSGNNSFYILDLNQIHFQNKNRSTILELFQQFLEYYHSFNFNERTITLRTVEPVKKLTLTPLYLENIFNSEMPCGDNISASELKTLQVMMRETLDELDHVSSEPDGSDEWGLLGLFMHLNSHK